MDLEKDAGANEGDLAKGITWTTERRKLRDLQPWPRNPRQIKTDQARRLVESFDQFGQVETIAIGPDNGIYNGHQRLNVLMQKYGGDYEVECRVSSRSLTEKEREKLTVFLHKGAAGEWDFDTLANEFELDELLEWGFDPKDLDLNLWQSDPPEDPGAQIDKAEELRQKWNVESGQLWQLGEHRLICGDCTDKAVVERVMDVPAMMLADPPYNVGLDYGDKTDDKRNPEEFWKWQHSWFELAAQKTEQQIITPGCINFEKWLIEFEPHHVCVWDKGEGANTYGRITKYWAWEPIMCHGKFERRRHTDVFRYSALGANPGHPCPKPIELWSDIIASFSDGAIFDPFLGSGTTLIACERLGRKCRAVEISPAYCAVAIERWHQMTGKEPVLLD